VRGSPLIRALAAFLIIAALAWPLGRLTHRSEANAEVLRTKPPEDRQVAIAFSFTHVPARVAIWHLGEQIWESDVKATEIDTMLEVPWPEEGIDLRVLIEWPKGNQLAGAQVRIVDPEGVEYERGIFSKGPADEILTLP
jgi:hypothetical protein